MGMLSKRLVLGFICGGLILAGSLPAVAQTTVPIPIPAEQAFNMVQMQTPAMPVVLVDVRTRAEVHWVGTAAAVTAIVLTSGETVVPDLGKVKLRNGAKLTYSVGGEPVEKDTAEVKSMTTTPIAYSVPYQYWDEKTGEMEINKHFARDMAVVAGDTKPVLILFCRSGGRTDAANAVAALDTSLFGEIYEIDQSKTNHGGMEGSSYSNVYNGYRGFPGRDTTTQSTPAVSWKDAGLPITIGVKLSKVLGR